jgi:hypothetical protein
MMRTGKRDARDRKIADAPLPSSLLAVRSWLLAKRISGEEADVIPIVVVVAIVIVVERITRFTTDAKILVAK